MTDSVTRDYWQKYFGDYGKVWVKDIPRKIQAAVLASEPQTRQADASKPTRVAFALQPLGVRKTEAGGVIVEAVARVATKVVPVVATFDAEGTLVQFARGAA